MSAPGQSEATIQKRLKAAQYATEPERFTLTGLVVTMVSEHGIRLIEYKDGGWACTCEFFAEHKTCSHIMALELILGEHAGLNLSPPDRPTG